MRGIKPVFRLPLLRRRDVVRDVDEELATHLAMREARLRARGLEADEAARVARERFGDVEAIRAECLREGETLARTERAMQLLDELRRDVHVAVRSLLRAKAFAAAVILTLALGIGANAVVFGLVNAVLLRPVGGVRHAESLFELSDVTSYPAFRELRARLPALTLAGTRERRIALGRGAAVEHSVGALVSGNFFDVAGVRAEIGRTLTDADDVPGAPPVAVLAFDYWAGPLGADSGVLGRPVTVNGAALTVVGVAARDFRGLHLGNAPAIWLPIHVWPVIAPSSMRTSTLESTGWEWVSVVGRLAPGMTLARAHRALAAEMAAAVPGVPAAALRDRAAPRPTQAAALPSGMREAAVAFLAVLGGVVALVLLTACANIAGLLLSRAAYRERELAVRVALGAGRGRLVRQLLAEALVLAAAGGAAGVGIFLGAGAVLGRLTLPGGVPASALGLTADARLVAFAAAVTLLTGLLVGLAPALQASRPDTAAALKGSPTLRAGQALARRGMRRRSVLRGALVTAQVAVGFALLVGTGLFARALARALALDPGFRVEPLAVLSVDPGLAQLDPARAAAYYAAVAARAAVVPGVRGVTWSSNLPLSGDMDREQAAVEGYTPAPDERVRVEFSLAGPRFHAVMGIPLVGGRDFDEHDAPGTQPVLVVNETLARRYFAGRQAVGSYITMHGTRALVVGVARDIAYHELGEPPRPYAYLALQQLAGSGVGSPTLVVRAAGDPAPVLRAVADAARGVNASVPVFGATTMRARLRAVLAPQLAGAWLLGVFSALALVVAAVGIYGVVAYAVNRRTREIGIRMALGAGAPGVLRLVVLGNLASVALGIPIGLALSAALGRGMASFLYGVPPADLPTLAGTSAVMLLVGLVAAYVPARRAVRVDPLLALRADG